MNITTQPIAQRTSQGCMPFIAVTVGDGVGTGARGNTIVGLPVIRASVDHGTTFDRLHRQRLITEA